MSLKAKKSRAKTTECKQSRAALWTIEMAVAAAEDGIKRLTTLQDHLYRAHRSALGTFHVARHHPLKGPDLQFVEDCIAELAERLDWPAGIGVRTPHEHLERPLADHESGDVARWAASAFAVTHGMLDLSELLDNWYGTLVAKTAEVAHSAVPMVTVEAHQKRAGKLILRLDRLCANERIAGVISAVATSSERVVTPGHRTPCGDSTRDEDDDTIARCGRLTTHWLH